MAVQEKTRVRRAKTRSPKFKVKVRPLGMSAKQAKIYKELDRSTLIMRRLVTVSRSNPASRSAMAVASSALRMMRMAAAAMSLGDCEELEPFGELRYVKRADGLYICCNHHPQHCTKVK